MRSKELRNILRRYPIRQKIVDCLDVEGLLDLGVGSNRQMDEDEERDREEEQWFLASRRQLRHPSDRINGVI